MRKIFYSYLASFPILLHYLIKNYNLPDGFPLELLTNMRDKTIGFRKEVTKEMEKRGMTSL